MPNISLELTDEQYQCCKAFIELPVHLVYEFNQELQVNVPRRRWPNVEALFSDPFHETLAVVLRAVPLPSTQAKIDQLRALEAEIQEGARATVKGE